MESEMSPFTVALERLPAPYRNMNSEQMIVAHNWCRDALRAHDNGATLLPVAPGVLMSSTLYANGEPLAEHLLRCADGFLAVLEVYGHHLCRRCGHIVLEREDKVYFDGAYHIPCYEAALAEFPR